METYVEIDRSESSIARHLASEGDGPPDHMEHFKDILYTLIFFMAIFFAGKVCGRIGMPALVGHIVTGVILGPNLLEFVPYPDALKLYGEIGLNLLVIEAGLHIDIETLEVVGIRGLAVGVLGSIVPMSMTFGAAMATGATALEGFGISASLAAMSTGIVLNILKGGGMINQPVGQLIISAAIVNEIVNLILLTELLGVVEDYETHEFIVPIVVMIVLVIFIGYCAIKVVPHVLDHMILPRIPKNQKENAILGILLGLSLGLMTGCKFTGSSELLGAFLGGFCFCTDHHVHRVWEKQIKRILQWMIRVFFACTIGFAIPIKDFWTLGVWLKAIAFLSCMSGKLAMGLLATPFNFDMICTLAFAWGEWGEFSFIIATLAFEGEVIDKEQFSAVILAVTISIIVSPLLLRQTLQRTAKHAEKDIEQAIDDTSESEVGKRHNVFYCLQTRSHARWGQQSNILSCVHKCNCKIIDFRTFHPYHHVGAVHVINELYLKDLELVLPVGVTPVGDDKSNLERRIHNLRAAVKEAMHDTDPEIKISRWEPGHGPLKQRIKKKGENLTAASKENEKRASSSTKSDESHAYAKVATEDMDLHAYRVAHDHLLLKAAQDLRHRRFKHIGHSDSMSISFHDVRPHHELDGFVHVEEHDAFPDFVSDASEEQIDSCSDVDEAEEEPEDMTVKLEAGLTRTEMFLESITDREKRSDDIQLQRRHSAPDLSETPPSSPTFTSTRPRRGTQHGTSTKGLLAAVSHDTALRERRSLRKSNSDGDLSPRTSPKETRRKSPVARRSGSLSSRPAVEMASVRDFSIDVRSSLPRNE